MSRPGVGSDLRRTLGRQGFSRWRRLSRAGRAGDRVGTKHGSDFGPDCHWNSCVPHLLAVPTHAGSHAIYAQHEEQNPTIVGDPHPSRQSFDATRRVLARTTIRAGSHLGSTLKPGGAVLTRGVFRRSGSVACIRVDASPNEVLTRPIMHERSDTVKSPASVSAILYAFRGGAHSIRSATGADLAVWRWPISSRSGRRAVRRCR